MSGLVFEVGRDRVQQRVAVAEAEVQLVALHGSPETGAVNFRQDNYRKAVIESALGIQVLKIDKLDDLQPVEAQFKRLKDDFLAFYCDGKGYESLFKRLRDTTAHAHYHQQPAGSIVLRHNFKGRGDKKAKLRLLGRLKYVTLKRLVTFL